MGITVSDYWLLGIYIYIYIVSVPNVFPKQHISLINVKIQQILSKYLNRLGSSS